MNNGKSTMAGEGDEVADAMLTRQSIFERLATISPAKREAAWVDFHARYAPVIAGFARRCGASRQDVDDIIQDVVAGFHKASGEFGYDPAKGRFRGWLKTCTVRAAVRRRGKNLRFRGINFEDVPEIELAVDPLWNDVWEQLLVSRALEELRAGCAGSQVFIAFEQYVLLDRNAEDVAQELATTVENVYQAKTRMTKKLRELVSSMRETDI